MVRSQTAMSDYQRPLLRWAGSKRKMIPVLVSCSPKKFGRYFEPFAGSACLYFAISPDEATLGDINPELMETYHVLRDHPSDVYDRVSVMPVTSDYYYALRGQDPKSLGTIERAARFVYLNRFCFNGVYRTNLLGQFNVPRGASTGSIPGHEEFLRCSRSLKKCNLVVGDFTETVSEAQEGDFVYLDPPYTTSSRPTYGEYGYNTFLSSKDLGRLTEILRQLSERGVVVLLSYSEEALTVDLFKEWFCCSVRVRRHIAGFSRHRTMVSEVLLCNQPFPAN